MDFVIGTKTNEALANKLLAVFRTLTDVPGTLYIGYPVLPTEGHHHRLDGLLVSKDHGVVIFQLVSRLPRGTEELNGLIEQQDTVYAAMLSKLSRTPQLLKRRQLAVPIHIVAFVSDEHDCLSLKSGFSGDDDDNRILVACPSTIRDVLADLPGLANERLLEVLNASIERVLTIKPRKRRANVQEQNSRGAVLKEIELQIANLDLDQKRGAIECPEGPQRIRGLAGSGKTIVLALKAAYLHAEHPNWEIAVVFFTRSLHQAFEDLIRRFYFDQTQDEPNWSKLHIMPAWGSARAPGLYSATASAHGIRTLAFDEAKQRYGDGAEAFRGACDQLLSDLSRLSETGLRPVFDAVLIDEAQDLPASFFRLAWIASRKPHRVVWAYDELQNLGNFTMPAPEVLFGTSGTRPLVELRREPDRPNPDVVLPKCYRNTPWVLTAAHSLGLRVHGPSLVQWVGQKELWEAIGYEVRSGTFRAGERVVLARRADSTPEFFERLIDPQDSLSWRVCASDQEQVEYVVREISRNLQDDELDPDDILVIYTNPLLVKRQAPVLQARLQKAGIRSHIAGITTSADDFSMSGSVTIASILRAKGNEAPMVYVLDAHRSALQHGTSPSSVADLARRRNILFTAVTRSRAWVRIVGVGDGMQVIANELERVIEDGYTLSFTVPTAEQTRALKMLGNDMTEQQREELGRARKSIDVLLESITKHGVNPDDIPQEQRALLIGLLTRTSKEEEEEEDVES